MEIGAVVSTCDCCGKRGHDKSRCQMRDGKCTICGKLDISRRSADNARKLTVKRIRQAISIRDRSQASPSPPMCSHISSAMVSSHAALGCQLWNHHCASFTKKKSGKVHDEFPPTQTNKVRHESRYRMIHVAYGYGKDGGYGTASLCPNDCVVVKTRDSRQMYNCDSEKRHSPKRILTSIN